MANVVMLEGSLPAVPIHCKAVQLTFLQRVNQLAKFADIQTNLPFSHAQFLTQENAAGLAHPAEEWVVAPFFNRARFLLLLCLHEHEPVGVLVRRTRELFFVAVHAPPVLFTEGTLLDGNLAGHNTFIITDALTVAGQSVADDDYVSRMRALPLFPKRDPKTVTATVLLQVRPFWFAQHPPEGLKGRDRVYIMVQAPWLPGRSSKNLRSETEPRIDFAVRYVAEEQVCQLAVAQDHQEPCKRVLHPVVLHYPVTQNLLDMVLVHHPRECNDRPVIVEFKYSGGTWHPCRQRVDRTRPNRLSTYQQCLQSITDQSRLGWLLGG